MKNIFIFIVILTCLISGTLKATSADDQGGPLYFWKGMDRTDAITIQRSYLSKESQKIITNFSKSCDLISPLMIGDRFATWRQDWNFRSHIYSYFRAANKDIYLLEYANPRNFAGNIFGRESLPEEWYLHYPANVLRKDTRVVTAWASPNPDINAINEWVYDMGNPEFVAFFTNRVVKAMQAGLDGLMIDNSGIKDYLWKVKIWKTGEKVVPINQHTNKPYTKEEQHAEYINMAQKIRAAVDSYNKGMSKQGRPFLLTPNIGSEIIDEEWKIVKIYGAAQSEGPAWFAPKNKVLTISEWLEHVTTVKQAMHLSVPWLYMGKQEKVPWPGKSRILFTYGSALLAAGAEGDRFFMRYNYGSDWPGFHVHIGHAKGDFYKYPGTKNIYARKFEKALVFVNPSDESETVKVDFSYRRFLDASVGGNLNWQGLSEVSLKNVEISAYSAEILVLDNADTSQKGTVLSPPTGLKRVSN
jgi:hypothetical protein